MSTVKTRFAPSPTGFLHSGNYRTAVFSYLFAQQQGGTFVLRSEDTDKERSKKEYEENIFESLKWLGLEWDEFSRQSEHQALHRTYLKKLIEDGTAYVSQETPKAQGERSEVIRFKNPGGKVSFTDLVRGEVSMEVDDLGDFVIAKSLDEPLFHLAVVVDDAESAITHVIRGEDHISNTPRQILIQRALNMPTPSYAHLPLILSPDHAKLSKRKGARALTEYSNEGYLPEAMLNYLAFLGWNPGDEREYLSREDLIKEFSLERVHKSGAIFDETKLLSINQHWMRTLSDEDYISRGNLTSTDTVRLGKVVPLLKERAHTFKEAQEMLSGELVCAFNPVTPLRDELMMKESAETPGVTHAHLEAIKHLLEDTSDDASADSLKEIIMPYADEKGRGEVLWPLRYSLSGAKRSPDPFTLIFILGREESIKRISAALAIIGK